MDNHKDNYYFYYLIVIFIIIVFFCSFSTEDSKKFNFDNKVELPVVFSKTFTSISNSYYLSEQDILVCISLESSSIDFINLLDSTTIRSINLDKFFKNVSTIIHKDNSLYCIFDQSYIYVINTDTFEITNTFYSKESFITKKGKYYDKALGFYNNCLLLEKSNYGLISVVNVKNGEIITNKKIDNFAAAGLSEEVLYITKKGFNVSILDPITLNEIWSYGKLGDRYSADVFINLGKVFYYDEERVIIFDAKTGDIIDSFASNLSIYTLMDNQILLNSGGSNITSINLENLTKEWEIIGSYSGADAYNDTLISYNREHNTLERFDKNTGELIWKIKWKNRTIIKMEELKDYYIFQLYGNELLILDKDTGEILWSYKTKNDGSFYWYICQNNIAIIEGNELVVYDASKIEQHKSPIFITVLTQNPKVVDDYVKEVDYQSSYIIYHNKIHVEKVVFIEKIFYKDDTELINNYASLKSALFHDEYCNVEGSNLSLQYLENALISNTTFNFNTMDMEYLQEDSNIFMNFNNIINDNLKVEYDKIVGLLTQNEYKIIDNNN